MSCSIVVNQQVSSSEMDNVTPEAKLKDPKRRKRGAKSHET